MWPMDGTKCLVRLEMPCCVVSWMMHKLWKAPAMSGAEIYNGPCLATHSVEISDYSKFWKQAIPAGKNKDFQITIYNEHWRVMWQEK